MRAESIHLKNVRNHADTVVDALAPKINVLIGENGAGKTSILEALSLTTIAKSFAAQSDAVLLRQGEQTLSVDARFVSDLGVGHHVAVEIETVPRLKKTIYANSERLRAFADLVGRAPVVVLTPDEKIITGGPPAERRRFLNLVLSQASRAYLEDEIEYRRALKQRNAILSEARQKRLSFSAMQPLLQPWTELVIKHGAPILRRRNQFIEEFRPRLIEAYRLLSESKEEPIVAYRPIGLEQFRSNFSDLLQAQAESLAAEEFRRGSTLFGPHRDEVLLSINPGQEARLYASQGQHKTLLVAMKLAEFEYLKDATRETPMLLLDDVFSELDEERARRLLELASSGELGQTFISSTERERFQTLLGTNREDHRIFSIERGGVLAR
ncbi:MAG TPA: DNA replication and repair protein RecF [Candidatus Kapabacteria bacterium]